MLPQFPNWKPLEVSDRADIEAVTHDHEPYSDYNFTSLWIWDTESDIEVCELNGNLAVRFASYDASGTPIFSFIGDNDIEATVETLIAYSEGKDLGSTLHLIPESTIAPHVEVLKKKYVIEEDRDNHDYVLSLDNLVHLKGSKFKKFRKEVRKFQKAHPDHDFRILDVTGAAIQRDIRACAEVWFAAKSEPDEDREKELASLERLFESAADHPIEALGLYIEGTLKAFQIFESAHAEHAVSHYFKADPSHAGIFQYLDHKTAVHLHEKGHRHFNIEQDLGIESLREEKEGSHPVGYLRKYKVSRKA